MSSGLGMSVSLAEAGRIVTALAAHQSVLLLSSPGVGKTQLIQGLAERAGLECRSLLGTQLCAEDISGVPTIRNERSVFCPPRALLPEGGQPFCLFLDELPASTPDVQKAFYSLLLERRIGEFKLPAGSWVVAAGNRPEDHALVRTISSALMNRVTILNVRVDVTEWLQWAQNNGIRREVMAYISRHPDSLARCLPSEPCPFSTPRSWACLSNALDRAARAGILDEEILQALVAGAVSLKDVEPFCDWFRVLRCGLLDVSQLTWSELCDRSISSIGLSQQTEKALHGNDLSTIGQLKSQTRADLRMLRGLDQYRILEIEIALINYGLRLRDATASRYERPSIGLGKAKSLVNAMADEQSLLLLSGPGVGKSAIIEQAAKENGRKCHSMLGTQISPEDVSGVPKIVGDRSVFCPPRVLLPEDPKPFCLFLDELPACPPDVQKAFYSLLLERRVGEFELPKGTWVVAAGNRSDDRALIRSMSYALLNRVLILNIRLDRKEWFAWAKEHGIRPEIRSFLCFVPEALQRSVPDCPAPFSSPRSWAALSSALDSLERAGALTDTSRQAVAYGCVSPEDAALFCTLVEDPLFEIVSVEDVIRDPSTMPKSNTARWFLVNQIRSAIRRGEFPSVTRDEICLFLFSVSNEFRNALLVDLVPEWEQLGASEPMLWVLRDLTGCDEQLAS